MQNGLNHSWITFTQQHIAPTEDLGSEISYMQYKGIGIVVDIFRAYVYLV